MDEKTIQRIKKLQALAERGVGGEKTTAQKKLAKLLKDIGAENRRCLIMQNRRAYPLQTLICSWAFYGKNCRDTQQ